MASPGCSHLIATVSGDEKAAAAKRAGADAAINYRTDNVAAHDALGGDNGKCAGNASITSGLEHYPEHQAQLELALPVARGPFGPACLGLPSDRSADQQAALVYSHSWRKRCDP